MENVENKDTRRTMRFWIISGIAAIAASQIPLLLRKKRPAPAQAPAQPADNPKRKARWVWWLLGAIALALLLWWLFD